jgi:hypothetical protein
MTWRSTFAAAALLAATSVMPPSTISRVQDHLLDEETTQTPASRQ